MKFFEFLNRHKTKLTGLVLVVLGSIQANITALQALLTPREFAWSTVMIGAIVAAIGFLNGRARQ